MKLFKTITNFRVDNFGSMYFSMLTLKRISQHYFFIYQD